MSFLQRVLNSGITPDTPYDLVIALRTAATVNVILSGVIFVFTLLFQWVAPGLVSTGVFGIVLLVSSAFLQYLGFHQVARMISSTAICATTVVMYCFAISQLNVPLERFYAVCVLVALAPWFMFTVEEMGYAVCATVVNLLLSIFASDLSKLLPKTADVSGVAHPAIQNMILVCGFSLLSLSTVFLRVLNRRESRKGTQLLEKLSLENAKIVEKERELNEAVEKLTAAQKEEQQRSWAVKGLAEAARIMRNDLNSDTMSDQLISFLVKYLGVNQGAFFLITSEGADVHFVLRACYAYDRKKFIDRKIDLEDGLLGQCYHEKNYIYITEVPNNYVHITSGLGFATPKVLLIVPLIANDVVTGVLEFASFQPIQKFQIEFLMDLGENIAMTFNNVQINERTKALLSETQMMTEQMRSQDEEMRQNLEEIAATQEHQARMEADLRNKLEEKEALIEKLTRKLERMEKTKHPVSEIG